jgi:hypothetical protein
MLIASAIGLIALPVAAAPEAEGNTTITSQTCEELNLFPFCTGPVYEAVKSFAVYADTNPDNPLPVAGNFTYVFTITNKPTSNATLGPLKQFDVAVPANGATSAGYIDGAGVEPSSIDIQVTVVRYNFDVDFIDPGETSEQLYLTSPFGPGEVTDTTIAVGSTFSIDTTSTCVGPVVAPPSLGCTIGFWKNRQDGKKGVLKFFPDGDFDAVKAEAVAISSVFATEAELVAALTSKGNRDIEERTKQQLAALLLNIAAGNLYPSNTKCRLFIAENGTQIDIDGDGIADLSLEAALTLIESNLLSGDPDLQHDAHQLADDINNGIGVLNSSMFQ